MAKTLGSLRFLVALGMAFAPVAACGGSSGQSPPSAGAPDGSTQMPLGDAAPSAADALSSAMPEAGAAVPDAMSPGGADAALTTDPGTACAGYAKAYCERYAACQPKVFQGLAYGTVADCETRILPYCMAEISAPGSARTASVTAACGAAVAAESCEDFLLETPPACRGVGTLANGAGCEFDSQCQSTRCATTSDAWCGKCAPRIAAGGECVNDPLGCDYGLLCPNSQVCTAPLQVNAPCTDSSFCAPSDVCMQGICDPLLAMGVTCSDSTQCALSSSCVLGSSTAVDRTCTAPTYATQVGAFCDYSSTYCTPPLTCVRVTDGGTTSVCQPATPDGQPCASGAQCEQPSMCVSGICTNVVDATSCP